MFIKTNQAKWQPHLPMVHPVRELAKLPLICVQVSVEELMREKNILLPMDREIGPKGGCTNEKSTTWECKRQRDTIALKTYEGDLECFRNPPPVHMVSQYHPPVLFQCLH
ncbi:hypothetical protein Trydic_g8446 [Trypoxylus dichotomus]